MICFTERVRSPASRCCRSGCPRCTRAPHRAVGAVRHGWRRSFAPTPRARRAVASKLLPGKRCYVGCRRRPSRRGFNFWALPRAAGGHGRARVRERRRSGGRRPSGRGAATRALRPEVPKSCNPSRSEDKISGSLGRSTPLPNRPRRTAPRCRSRTSPGRHRAVTPEPLPIGTALSPAGIAPLPGHFRAAPNCSPNASGILFSTNSDGRNHETRPHRARSHRWL